jgi:transcriptional regulator of acetoin/glycerol metabolism
LAVPIKVKGKVIGVLDAQSALTDVFSQIDIYTLGALADQLAVAIENARLYEQTSKEIAERKQVEKERERLIGELQSALAKVKTLSGLIPICSSCKKIRDDKGYWQQVETYIANRSNAEFSHGFCPECMDKLYPELAIKKDS